MTAIPDGGIGFVLVTRKYGTDFQVWGTNATDGSAPVKPFGEFPGGVEWLRDAAREGWTLMRFNATVLDGQTVAAAALIDTEGADVHPNLQARCEHGSWWDRFNALPYESGDDEADEAAMEKLMAEFDAALGADAELAWMLLIGAASYMGEVNDEVRHLLAMVGRPAGELP